MLTSYVEPCPWTVWNFCVYVGTRFIGITAGRIQAHHNNPTYPPGVTISRESSIPATESVRHEHRFVGLLTVASDDGHLCPFLLNPSSAYRDCFVFRSCRFGRAVFP